MSEHIFLRPLVMADAEISYRWRNIPEIWKFTRFNPSAPITLQMEKEWLEKTLKCCDERRFAICLTENKRYIGNVQLIDIKNEEAEFHIFIGEADCWGKGIGEEATRLILDYAFFVLNLNKVRLDVDRANAAAIKIYKRNGFTGLKNEAGYLFMEISRKDYESKKELPCMNYIVTLDQEIEWRNIVKRAAEYDFYHSWTYHSLSDSSGFPLLFVYEEQNDFIAMPLLKRHIQDSEYCDMSCVYGYSGPISNKKITELSPGFTERFKTSFLKFLKEENTVTVFSRLNPFFGQVDLMRDFGGVVENGKVVVLDLSIPIEEQRKKYQERASRKIRQLRKKGYYVKQADSNKDIDTFIEIYTLNMLRVNASPCYYFNEDYFKTLLNSDEFDARLMFVYNQKHDPVCGVIVVITNGIMHAHLLGTRAEYLSDSPAKLLTEEATILGRALGARYYNLGGGFGFKEDTLFRWKTSFSRLTFKYNSWRFVVNKEGYEDLLKIHDVDPGCEVDFFPLYRLQANKA